MVALMSVTSPLSPLELLQLTDPATITDRVRPYGGDPVSASMSALLGDDADIVRNLYRFLTAVYGATRQLCTPEEGLAALRATLAEHDHHAVFDQVRRLGDKLPEDTPRALRKVYHDLRDGSLTGLIMHLALVADDQGTPQDVTRIYLLTRDHLKIMRNALPDLDAPRYAADLCRKEHGVALLAEKWAGALYGPRGRPVRIDLQCDFVGGVSECCLEFSALDRVLYNLVNNAARFATDDRVQLAVLPLDGRETTNLRLAVANRVTPEHAALLRERFGDELGRLFLGRFTTGGRGLGLEICGDFVCHVYGLMSPREALALGHVGAALVRDRFVAWFHWPGRRLSKA
jgi:signal transduction histidine kinase